SKPRKLPDIGVAKCGICLRSHFQGRRTDGRTRDTAGVATHDHCTEPRVEIGVNDLIPLTTTVFNLPEHLVAKANPPLIAGDELHLAAVAESLEQQIAGLSDQLDAQRKAPGGQGRAALDRDLEIHRLTASLRVLR